MKKHIKKNISLPELEERIVATQQYVLKTKETYDNALAQLKKLLDKKEEVQSEELLKAISKSAKTYDEIMKFLSE